MKPSTLCSQGLVFMGNFSHLISVEEATQQGMSNSGGSWNVLMTFPESQLHDGLHQKRHDQQVKGGDSSPLFCSCETTWSTVSSSVAPSIIEQVQSWTTKIIRWLEHLSYDFLQECVVTEQGLMAFNWKRLGLN